MEVDTRAQVITRRTYNRPLNSQGTLFETWAETIDRVISHQTWLWERAQGKPLSALQRRELDHLRALMLERKALPSGRTLWLGGTEVSRTREASQFNCAFNGIESVFDVVDAQWLLMQGCGVGFKPDPGVLNGFANYIGDIRVNRSTRIAKGGYEVNQEYFDEETLTWTIRVGDSAEAWAKAVGKLLAGKYPARSLVFDFSEIRPAGGRLKGYGWISSGDSQISKAFVAIADILNKRSGELLSKLDILDVLNWMGTILSSRRSAEIALCDYGSDEWREFAYAKLEPDPYNPENPQRYQSNNSLVFNEQPSFWELSEVFDIMTSCGGSEPGIINGQTAKRRAPWFRGVNPCAEILLGSKSFCNLVEIDVGKFKKESDLPALLQATYLIARANYRQTCVNLDDGVLQRSWHELNEYLRLCGVGLTGIVKWDLQNNPWALLDVKSAAKAGATDMARELGLPEPKAVTTVKPSGTLSKIMGTTEGIHKPLGKYIFNNVGFSIHDPLVKNLQECGYRTIENPTDPTSILVTFPVSYPDVAFTTKEVTRNGQKVFVEVNQDSAIDQLNRYLRFMDYYADHNVSITVSYDATEIGDIVEWLLEHWDSYVGVSFLLRADPTTTAADLGYAYLPQEVVTKEDYESYVKTLKPFSLDNTYQEPEAVNLEVDDGGCASGICPVR